MREERWSSVRKRWRHFSRGDSQGAYRATRGNQGRRENQRAGGKGAGGNHRNDRERGKLISKKLSTICRHSNDVQRQKGGFIDIEEIMNYLNRRGDRYLEANVDDVERIVRCDGGNFKMRFGRGGLVMVDVRRASLRDTSKDRA